MELSNVRRISLIAIGIAMVSTAGIVGATTSPPMDVAVDYHPEGSKGENAAWLGYILARAHFVDDHHDLHEQTPGPILPTFAEELTARNDAVKIYRELLAKDPTLDVPYFDELVSVADSSYMPEYVWTFLRQSTWSAQPANLRLSAFDTWRKLHLPNHHALTKGSLQFVPRKVAPPLPDASL